jgi:uncharacterized lipoprotein YmbA
VTTRRVMPIVFSVLMSGCGFLSSKPSRFFALERIPASGPAPSARGVAIGVVGVLPPGLDRKEIAVRKADHQLEIRGREQWTASLEPLVLSTLAYDLADRLPEGMVILPGQPRPDAGMRNLDVVFEELASGPDRSVILDARWTLRSPGRPDITHHEQVAVDLQSLDSPDISTGLSRALATLADRIAAQLAAL